MINKLFTLLKKPTIWQRSTVPFWDDEHISKGMLEAHLNPDWEAASRKHEMIDRSVKWLSTVIPTGGKILDIGCGPGLYAKRLSGMGYDVTGMDFSKRSIAYAKEHDTKSKYIYQNYLELEYTNIYDSVLLIYCDYAALTLPERKVLLSKVHRALKPGGLFVFDVFTEGHFKSKCSRTNWSVHQNGGFWSVEPYICMEATHLYEDDKVAVEQSVILTADSMTEYLIWDTAYTKQKLIDEVLPFDFQVKGLYDDVCGSPYTGESETLCIVLERGAK